MDVEVTNENVCKQLQTDLIGVNKMITFSFISTISFHLKVGWDDDCRLVAQQLKFKSQV
jgi:hypothetical protein